MSKIKLYSPDRLVLHSVAADHYRQNTDTTAKQLAQLFGLTVNEAGYVMRSVHQQTEVKASVMQDAITWAIERNAGFMRIMDRFRLSEGNAKRVAAAAKAANKEKAAEEKKKLDEAMQYANANQLVAAAKVAEKFGVSVHSVERLRRVCRLAQPAIEQKAIRKTPRRTLYAITTDGEQIDPRRVRDVSKIERFVEVMV